MMVDSATIEQCSCLVLYDWAKALARLTLIFGLLLVIKQQIRALTAECAFPASPDRHITFSAWPLQSPSASDLSALGLYPLPTTATPSQLACSACKRRFTLLLPGARPDNRGHFHSTRYEAILMLKQLPDSNFADEASEGDE